MPPLHDHNLCVDNALKRAQLVCDRNGARLTQLRIQVLTIIWNSHKPILAYDILNELKQQKPNAQPPTIYRALDFLLENHLIHKIESLNAYIGCDHADHQHISQFLLCTKCKEVSEVDSTDIIYAIDTTAAQQGFKVQHQTVEVSGICSHCRDQAQ